MYHGIIYPFIKHRGLGISPQPRSLDLSKLVLVRLAFLVSNTARGLASGLAGGLAFAATAVVYTLSEITGLDGLNSLHDNFLLIEISLTELL